MAMKRCPVCGEKYSDTYRDCPFCEEDEALLDGEEIRRTPKRGRRAAHGKTYSLITPTLIVLILIMAGLLVYLLYGDQLSEKFGKGEASNTPPTQEIIPVQPGTKEEEPGPTIDVMPEKPDTEEPTDTEDPEPSGETPALSEYELTNKLPEGLSLSTTDFTLKKLGETHTIRASGGSNTYTWVSEDEGIASVDSTGKVTAVSNGTVHVLVTDGNKKGVCIVRVSASGGQTVTPSAPSAPSTPSTPSAPSAGTSNTSGLKAGAAKVVNGGNGVRVRSGPGTNYEILATVSNGADIQIVESAGDGWYKITFSNIGGVTTPGYMKGDYLANK